MRTDFITEYSKAKPFITKSGFIGYGPIYKIPIFFKTSLPTHKECIDYAKKLKEIN